MWAGRVSGGVGGPVHAHAIAAASPLVNMFHDAEEGRRLYLSNFRWETSEDDLRALVVERVGVVPTGVALLLDTTGRSRGAGFVTLPSAADAERAVQALHLSTFGGRCLACRIAQPRRHAPRNPPPGHDT